MFRRRLRIKRLPPTRISGFKSVETGLLSTDENAVTGTRSCSEGEVRGIWKGRTSQ